jgi:3-oxoadipate enol-lactonase
VSFEVHHQIEGNESAPPLLLSNSLGTAVGMWDEQMPAVSPHFRVIRYDQRGHGASPVPRGPYSIGELGEDVIDMLDRLEIERVNFCGASMGGMTGMWLAINAPERIDRLAVCCTSAHIPPRKKWLERAALVRSRGVEAIVDASLERWFTPALRNRRPERVEQMRETLLGLDPEGYAACCEAVAEIDLRDRLDEIRAPTLVITGEDDLSTPPDHGRQIADAVDGAECLMLSPARHLANVERADDVNRALLAHLLSGPER